MDCACGVDLLAGVLLCEARDKGQCGDAPHIFDLARHRHKSSSSCKELLGGGEGDGEQRVGRS